ncbi:hypothetical protein NPIL_304531 [Nephila pilipes]|uniref:Uncharacterized protein n=1 Tax=Nephila pilipes TaxID=299642 RepID=A0A8X6P8S6_NEPPI|nr:hypothetical protein NPIL_304531 [Nephila pilipes]
MLAPPRRPDSTADASGFFYFGSGAFLLRDEHWEGEWRRRTEPVASVVRGRMLACHAAAVRSRPSVVSLAPAASYYCEMNIGRAVNVTRLGASSSRSLALPMFISQ